MRSKNMNTQQTAIKPTLQVLESETAVTKLWGKNKIKGRLTSELEKEAHDLETKVIRAIFRPKLMNLIPV